jgi:hypothetical protein
MKRLLIVSPHFPPTNAPDMQRVRMSLRYYRQFGWDPLVLAVDAATAGGIQEPELLATVPADVPVVTVRALPQGWTRLVGVGTLGLRCLPRLQSAGTRLLRSRKFDLVFFSNTQFTTFTLGRAWKQRFGTPYVLDVQDPWRTDYYERKGSRRPPGAWKYQFARLQARLLEGWAFGRASGIISVSPGYVTALQSRYPVLRDVPTAIIRFGASRADLTAARQTPLSPTSPPREPRSVQIVYTGASGPVTPHAMTVLFEALRRYRERSPAQARRLRFHFFGTSYVPPGQGTATIVPLAAAAGVADQVNEIPHRLGHLECLRLQAEADVLLLPGSSDLDYSPSKTYPYYLTGKPMVGLVFRGSVLERLLEDLRCTYLVRMGDDRGNEQAYAELARFFDLALAGFPNGSLPQRNDALFEREYLAQELTRQQCSLFDEAVAREESSTRPRSARNAETLVAASGPR